MASTEGRVPKKRGDLVEVDLTDEIVIYDQKTGDAHALNGAAAKVWRLLTPTSTLEKLAARLGEKSEVDGRATVRLALRQFATVGLLEEKVPAAIRGGVSRRAMLQQLAFAGAAIPAIQSVKAPQGAIAISAMPCSSAAPTCLGVCPGNSCCVCTSTIEGGTVCGAPTCTFATTPCTSSAQCGAGFVCVGPSNLICCNSQTAFCVPLCTPTFVGGFCNGLSNLVAAAQSKKLPRQFTWEGH